MNKLSSEVDSLLESDEVSQIDGLQYTRSRSYSDVHDYHREKPPLLKTISVRGIEPDIAKRHRKYEERARRKTRERDLKREIEKSIEESIEESSETRRKTPKPKLKTPPPEPKKKKAPEPKKSLTKRLKEKVTKKKEPKSDSESEKVESPKKSKKDYVKLPPHTKEEIIKLTEGFIPIPRVKWESIEAGREIKWMTENSGRVSERTAFYWYQKENKDGKRFFMCGPTAQCDMKTQWINKQKFPLFWDKLKRLYVREDPFTQGLRLAIDNRTYQLSDIANFLKLKFGDEFEQFIKNREFERRAKSSKK